MYTCEWDKDARMWSILDPDCDHICYVRTQEEANGLLSHLNRY